MRLMIKQTLVPIILLYYPTFQQRSCLFQGHKPRDFKTFSSFFINDSISNVENWHRRMGICACMIYVLRLLSFSIAMFFMVVRKYFQQLSILIPLSKFIKLVILSIGLKASMNKDSFIFLLSHFLSESTAKCIPFNLVLFILFQVFINAICLFLVSDISFMQVFLITEILWGFPSLT